MKKTKLKLLDPAEALKKSKRLMAQAMRLKKSGNDPSRVAKLLKRAALLKKFYDDQLQLPFNN